MFSRWEVSRWERLTEPVDFPFRLGSNCGEIQKIRQTFAPALFVKCIELQTTLVLWLLVLLWSNGSSNPNPSLSSRPDLQFRQGAFSTTKTSYENRTYVMQKYNFNKIFILNKSCYCHNYLFLLLYKRSLTVTVTVTIIYS